MRRARRPNGGVDAAACRRVAQLSPNCCRTLSCRRVLVAAASQLHPQTTSYLPSSVRKFNEPRPSCDVGGGAIHRRPRFQMALSLLAPTATAFTTYPWVPKRGAEWEAKPWSSNEISDQAGLEALAKKLNPVVGYWGERRIANAPTLEGDCPDARCFCDFLQTRSASARRTRR